MVEKRVYLEGNNSIEYVASQDLSIIIVLFSLLPHIVVVEKRVY